MSMYLLFIAAFLIRFISLNQSLWLDEAVVAKVVRTIPFFQIPTQFSPGDFHPPLYYLFMSLWSDIFGSSEIVLRLPSIIFSLIAGFYVYKIGILIKDKKVGFWGAAFFLFNPLIIYYSQEARMYMLSTMLLSIALYYFICIIKSKTVSRTDIILFNLFCALAVATFYGSVFFIVGMIIVGIFIKPKISTFIYLSIGTFFVLLFLTPLLLQQLQTAKIGLSVVKNWSLVLGKAELKNVVMIFIKFTSGRLSWFPKISYYLVAGGWAVVVGIFIFLGIKKSKILTYLFVLPLLLGLFVSFWAPMMMYFRFLYLIPTMSILLAVGISKKDKYSVAVLTLFVIFSFIYLLIPQFYREDWKKMVSDMSPAQPVYMILPSSDPVTYYNSNLSLFEMRSMEKQQLPEYIQVIPYVEEIYGYSHVAVLEKKGCVKVGQSEYRGPLILEVWKCLRNA